MTAPNGYYEVTAVESGDVVTVADFKLFARIDTNADDVLIQLIINAAVEDLEAYTGEYMLMHTVDGYFHGVACYSECQPWVEIQRGPIDTISNVWLWNGDAYEATAYILKRKKGFSRLLFPALQSMTLCHDNTAYPIKTTFDAGYGAGNIPATYIEAVKMLANARYSNRGDCACDGVSTSEAGLLKSILGSRIMRAF